MSKFIQLIGKRFGSLLITGMSVPTASQPKRCRFKGICDCGNTWEGDGKPLREGRTVSCGKCVQFSVKIGDVYGKWTVMSKNDTRKVECKCDCGNISEVGIFQLQNGLSKSCGCTRFGSTRNNKAPGYAGQHALFLGYKRAAADRNYNWELSREEFNILTKNNCNYCGNAPSSISNNRTLNGQYLYNGIDRKDNNMGYTSDNSVTCCKICNFAKNDRSYTDFMEWIRRVSEFRNIKQITIKENIK